MPHHRVLTKSENCPLVSIIILTFNQHNFTEECLAALERYTPEPFEVIIIDNGSHDGTASWLQSLAASNPHYHLILNSTNRGFAAGCNQGLDAAKGTYLVLLNNDVVVTPEWLTGLMECHRAEPYAGIVGPLTNNASGIQGLGNATYDSLDSLAAFANSFRISHRYRRVLSRRLVGFCMLFSRQLYQEIGGLDECFGTGNFEDDDFCLRAAIAGYLNLVAGDVYVHHHGSVSFRGARMNYRAALTGNWTLFREKWSRPVADKAHAGRIAACRAREDAEHLLFEGKSDEALTVLEHAYREYGEYRPLRQLLSCILYEAGRSDEALTLIPAEAPLALTIRARSLMTTQRCDEAESLLVSAIAADPGYGGAYLLRGNMARQRGEEEFAATLTLKGFQLSPALPEHVQAAEWLIESQWAPQLSTTVKEAVQLYPHSRPLARLRVEMLHRSGDDQALLEATECFVERFGFDERVLSLGIAARNSLGPWLATAPAGYSVSLCMIVKDEERHIVRCLASCRPFVHEMVVVDTGSSDHTAELAELMGARVINHPWREDFAEARNVSIDSATGDWILVMDGDEVLSPRDYADFNSVLHGRQSPCAFTLVTRNYTTHTALAGYTPVDGAYPEEEAGLGWTPSAKVRLFPNHFGIRFEGVVHEMVEGMVTQARLTVQEHLVPIHHYGGLEEERLERKRKLYYVLGQQKLEAGGVNPKALYELAVQAGELERFSEAEEYWLALLEKEPVIPVAWFNLSYIYLKMGRLGDAVTAAERAVALKPDYQEALVNLALGRFCLLPPADALKALEEICAEDPSIHVLRNVALCLNNRLDEGVAGLRDLVTRGHGFADFLKSTATLLCSVGRQEEGQVLEALRGIFG